MLNRGREVKQVLVRKIKRIIRTDQKVNSLKKKSGKKAALK